MVVKERPAAPARLERTAGLPQPRPLCAQEAAGRRPLARPRGSRLISPLCTALQEGGPEQGRGAGREPSGHVQGLSGAVCARLPPPAWAHAWGPSGRKLAGARSGSWRRPPCWPAPLLPSAPVAGPGCGSRRRDRWLQGGRRGRYAPARGASPGPSQPVV